jgi:hypothetical protein
MYSRAGVVGFAAFLLCALLLFTGFVPYTAAHAHVGSLRNVAVYCGTVYRVALVAPHRVDSTAARPFDTRRPPCALSLVRRKLSFALQLPSGCSCPHAVRDLRLYSFILASVSAVFHVSGSRTKKSLHQQPDRSTGANIK